MVIMDDFEMAGGEEAEGEEKKTSLYLTLETSMDIMSWALGQE